MLSLNRLVPATALVAFCTLCAPTAAHADLALSLFLHGTNTPTNTFTVNVGQLLQIDAQVLNLDTTQGALTGTASDSINPTPSGLFDDSGALLNFSSVTLNAAGTPGDSILANAINFTPAAADAGRTFNGTLTIAGNTALSTGAALQDISQNYTINVSGTPPVPEASSVAALVGMSSIGGLLAMRRRRN